jgi:hypothetical protein
MDEVNRACKPLKDVYEQCNTHMFQSVVRDKKQTSLFTCELAFQDYKDCFELKMKEMIDAKKQAKKN